MFVSLFQLLSDEGVKFSPFFFCLSQMRYKSINFKKKKKQKKKREKKNKNAIWKITDTSSVVCENRIRKCWGLEI